MMQRLSLFDDQRTTLEDAIQMSIASLTEYGQRYRHWAVAYSGGKDSSATVAFVAWAVRSGLVPRPESLTVLYADTRQEYPPLHGTAMEMLARLRADGFDAKTVLPKIEDRFYVYMLGRGVPPPSNTFRWCTPQLKVEPMQAALKDLRQQAGEKILMLTGVRLGESEQRDARIALSCSKDSGECGQGWFQVMHDEAVTDTLAPLLHWRLCHVFDWLYFENERHGYGEVAQIAAVYGEDDVRTGCIGCNLASKDRALEALCRTPEWSHLTPLLELKPLFRELKQARHRKRKTQVEYRQDGTPARNVNRLGPLTMEARAWALEQVKDIQKRARVDLINAEEEKSICQMWAANVWPNKWTGDEIGGDVAFDAYSVGADGSIAVQPLLVR